jgi:hypothetical protein
MNLEEFARLGGKARWKGTTKKQRSEAMKKVRQVALKVIHSDDIDEQAREV